MRRELLGLWSLPKWGSMLLIRIYQKTISPDHGPMRALFPFGYCKFHPTCSQYGYEAIEQYGFVVGWLKAFWRILRCNPCSRGGNDPVIK